ncbi:hypothetical protein AAMO2058_000613200 [Amorphochlora amoebiformis]
MSHGFYGIKRRRRKFSVDDILTTGMELNLPSEPSQSFCAPREKKNPIPGRRRGCEICGLIGNFGALVGLVFAMIFLEDSISSTITVDALVSSDSLPRELVPSIPSATEIFTAAETIPKMNSSLKLETQPKPKLKPDTTPIALTRERLHGRTTNAYPEEGVYEMTEYGKCTLWDKSLCKERSRNFTTYWNRRWDNHYKFHDIRWGRYNGCHRWKNNTDGTVLWLYLPNHVRAPGYWNWKSFLQHSHPAGCYFIVLAARGELDQKGYKHTLKTYSRLVDKRDPSGQVKKKLEKIWKHYEGTNVAWYVAQRIRTAPNPCGWPGWDWPQATSDYWNSAESFGAWVADTHGIPTSPYDVIVHARPDFWFANIFDHDEVYHRAKKNKEQIQLLVRQTDNWSVGSEDPGNQMFIHTRGAVESLCVRNFKYDPNKKQCGMCYGQTNNPAPKFACGHEFMRLSQSLTRAGVKTYYMNPRFFAAVTGIDKEIRVPVNGLGRKLRGECSSVPLGRREPPCTRTKLSLFQNRSEIWMDLDGSDETNACKVGPLRTAAQPLGDKMDRYKFDATRYGYQFPDSNANEEMHIRLWGLRDMIFKASEYTLFEHPTRGPIAIIGPFFMGAYFYAPVEVLPAPSREATHARRNARRNSSY